MNRDRFGKSLYHLFLLSFSIFPITCAFLCTKDALWEMQYKKFAFIFVALCFIATMLLFWLCQRLKAKIEIADQKLKAALTGWLFLVSMTIKYVMITGMGGNVFQNSEYGIVYRISIGMETEADLQHISVYPHWSLVGILNRCLYKIFANDAVSFFQLINALILSLAVIAVFYLSLRVTRNIASAFLGALFFAIAPTENIYFLFLSNEFIATFSCLMIMILFVKYDFFSTKINRFKKKLILSVFLGILFFLVQYSKPIGSVFTVAFVIVFVLKALIDQQKNWKQPITMMVLALIVGVILSQVYLQMLSKYTGVPANENAAPHFLAVGLYSKYPQLIEEYGGKFNVYERVAEEEKFQYDVVNQRYMEMIEADLRENIRNLPQKLKANFIEQWKDYKNGLRMAAMQYTVAEGNYSLFDLEGITVWGGVITQLFYMSVLFYAMISVLRMLLFEREYCVAYIFVCLVCFGVALGLMFGEQQERYKCVVMPILYLLAGDGMRVILKGFSAVFGRIAGQIGYRFYHGFKSGD